MNVRWFWRMIASPMRDGRRRMSTPTTCPGSPTAVRGTMLGGVRIEMRTRRAPCSTRSSTISAPVLPEPTTSTSRPR